MKETDITHWCSDDRRARFALAHICDPADALVDELCARQGAPATLARLLGGGIANRDREVYALRWTRCDLSSEHDRAEERGIRWLVRGDAEWPRGLDDVGVVAPHVLWVQGSAHLARACDLSLAMVGARACTHYGADVARAWAAELASSGVTIVSGGAFGIDASAHRGALATGNSILVTAAGIDSPYPRAHEGLFASVAERGCVVSESPLGSSVRRARFLTRNRVIAAMSRATLIVEAAHRSGSLNTARHAAEVGRQVLAVPGPVTSALSHGCHGLVIDRRAELVTGVRDVLSFLVDSVDARQASSGVHLSVPQRTLLDSLPESGGASVDDLIAASGMARHQVERTIRELATMARVLGTDATWSRRTR
ncbi:MAG: DNA-protecting protein DprA [Actinobacteria bacterium]|nr:DNA-protecting protein DprA [Actinomycetota bacterium]